MTAYPGIADRQTGTSEINRMDFVVRQILAGVATATVVLVKAVSDDGLVDVQPLVAQLDGAGKSRPHGVINNLPILRLQGGAYAVLIDPAVGDMGLAVFCHNDISSAKETKGPANPGSRRKFSWSDGVYVGRLWGPEATQFIRIDGDGVTITSTGTVTINADGDVTIDATGTTTVTGDLAVDGTLTVGGDPYLEHTHDGVTTGGGVSGPVTA